MGAQSPSNFAPKIAVGAILTIWEPRPIFLNTRQFLPLLLNKKQDSISPDTLKPLLCPKLAMFAVSEQYRVDLNKVLLLLIREKSGNLNAVHTALGMQNGSFF